MDDQVPWTLLFVSCGFMLFKQYINIVQLVEACKWLMEGDLEMRKRAGWPASTARGAPKWYRTTKVCGHLQDKLYY